MSPAEAKLLKKLLRARFPANEEERWSGSWVEVGRFVGIEKSTVKAFEKHGLIETEGRCVTQTWARLIIPE